MNINYDLDDQYHESLSDDLGIVELDERLDMALDPFSTIATPSIGPLGHNIICGNNGRC